MNFYWYATFFPNKTIRNIYKNMVHLKNDRNFVSFFSDASVHGKDYSYDLAAKNYEFDDCVTSKLYSHQTDHFGCCCCGWRTCCPLSKIECVWVYLLSPQRDIFKHWHCWTNHSVLVLLLIEPFLSSSEFIMSKVILAIVALCAIQVKPTKVN